MKGRVLLAAAVIAAWTAGSDGSAQNQTTPAAPVPETGDNILLRLEGTNLAYSFDLNRIMAYQATFRFAGYDVSCSALKADIASRTFLALGGVTLRKDGTTLRYDEFLFKPGEPSAVGFLYGDAIDVRSFPDGAVLPEPAVKNARDRKSALDDLSLARIRESLISSTARVLEITPAYEVIGLDVVMFVEGLPSVGFSRFKLSLGEKQRTGGFSLDKIWFNRNQGLFANAAYLAEKKNTLHSLTQARYEEHSILKSYDGLARQIDLQTETTWTAAERFDLGLAANFNSTGLWNARMSVDRKLPQDRGHVLLGLSFNKPLGRQFEAWLGFQTFLRSSKWGTLNVEGKTELRAQRLAAVDYSLPLGKYVQLGLNSRYSRLRLDGVGGTSHIFTGNFNLSYNAEHVTAAAEYYLNKDLVGNQRLARPQLRFGLRPFRIFDGLLEVSVQNTLLANALLTAGGRSQTYSNNTAFSLSARPVFLRPDWSIQITAALEQFLEKEGRNFTSGGLIVRSVYEITPSISLEGFYGLQSRRRTRGWLIEGTTSQDLSAMLRINPEDRLNGWVTVSYDPKNGEWKQGFADLAIGLIRNWEFQTLLNYDFYRRRIQNVDLYLVRHAGRFDLRFIWRSLSKQILIELIPALGGRRPIPASGNSGDADLPD
ncbi:MAG: hypothetical protein NTW38_08560 [Candidatus Aminicenantes bacterium]|nr:hypothetical protein [Candidatus Aminicenantes bacterium]